MPSMLAVPAALALIPLIKVTVFLGTALLFLPLLRRTSASLRHCVCLLALCGSVLLIPLSLTPTPVSVPIAVDIAETARTAAATPAAAVPWGRFLLALWTTGFLLVILRYTAGLLAVRSLRARSVPVDDPAWLADLQALNVGAVQLRYAPVGSALTCGLLRPAILLPFEGVRWHPAHRHAVLLHEIAHVRRHDLWSGALAAFVTGVLWFHPFAWMLAARMREEQECACDDAVLNLGVAPSRYAELLLHSASETPDAPLCACAMTGRYAFRSRLVHILDPGRNRLSRRATLKQAVAVAVALVAVLALLRPAAVGEEVHKVGGDVLPPKLIQKVEPKYTEAAKDAKIEGTVTVHIIVGTDGRVRRARIVKSLDPGLDNNALDALSQWVFEPGTKQGKPVPVRAQIEMNFRLK